MQYNGNIMMRVMGPKDEGRTRLDNQAEDLGSRLCRDNHGKKLDLGMR